MTCADSSTNTKKSEKTKNIFCQLSHVTCHAPTLIQSVSRNVHGMLWFNFCTFCLTLLAKRNKPQKIRRCIHICSRPPWANSTTRQSIHLQSTTYIGVSFESIMQHKFVWVWGLWVNYVKRKDCHLGVTVFQLCFRKMMTQ